MDIRGEEESKMEKDKDDFKHKQEGKEAEQTYGGKLRRRLRGLQVGVHKWTVWGTVHCIALAYIPGYMVFT